MTKSPYRIPLFLDQHNILRIFSARWGGKGAIRRHTKHLRGYSSPMLCSCGTRPPPLATARLHRPSPPPSSPPPLPRSLLSRPLQTTSEYFQITSRPLQDHFETTSDHFRLLLVCWRQFHKNLRYARHSWTYTQDFQLTYKTYNKNMTIGKPDRNLAFQLAYKTFNKTLHEHPTAYETSNQFTWL